MRGMPASSRLDWGDQLVKTSFTYVKPKTDTGVDHSLERSLSCNADVECPSFGRQMKVNRENALVATQHM